MRQVIIFTIILVFSKGLLAVEPDFCKNISELSKELDEYYDKKELLETAKNCFESLKENKEYIILLSKLYILNENYLYAKKILVEYYQKNEDCEIVGYIAYIDFMVGDSDSLKESLNICADKTDVSDELKSRFLIIRSYLKESFEPNLRSIYPEDLKLVLKLYEKHRPPFLYNFKAKGGFGYTTNAFSSSPLDTMIKLEKDSTLVDYDFAFSIKKEFFERFLWGLESGLRGTKFFNSNGNFSPNNLSSMSIILSPVFEHKSDKFQGILKYKFDTLLLNMDTEYQKAPIQYFEGHRAELYLNLYSNYTLFLGGGRRYFDEIVRGRREFDGGFGYFKTLTDNLSALLLLTVRYYDANSKGYDDFGQSALIKFEYKSPIKLNVSQFLSFSFDNYINSVGYFVDAKKREDKLLRYNLETNYSLNRYLGLYLTYTFSYRDSLIDTFSYEDHRILLGVTLNLQSERDIPKVNYKYNFEREYYPLESSISNLQDMMDVLKENDSIQRGSQCKD